MIILKIIVRNKVIFEKEVQELAHHKREKQLSTYLKYQGLIAPCGMNCGLCIGHLRKKKPCGGCFKMNDVNKPKVCRSCKIVNCELLAKTDSGFCYDCAKYPCTRLKNLDKRYRSKYRMSMLENLAYIKKKGLETFLKKEEKKWKCKTCGAGLSVHRNICLNCKTAITITTCSN